MVNQRSAPVYLNLFRIRFPVGAVTSIAHRISGVLMVACFPLLIYLLDISLQNPAGFDRAVDYLQSGWLRAGSAIIAWSLFHHLLSGIRFLFIDMGHGLSLPHARRGAWLVNIAGLAMTLVWLWWIL
ncbi:MAG: succinate dehydrogenase, cytochrome b556 subunit [Pseudomonadota bacterium]